MRLTDGCRSLYGIRLTDEINTANVFRECICIQVYWIICMWSYMHVNT